MSKNVAIKVTNLTKSYKLYTQPIDRVKESLNLFGKKYHKDFNAVKGLTFEVYKGETVGIIGRNGCGKSTLLKMITNVLTPSSGRVIVHGHVSAILELGAGFNPEMTGLENIYLNTSINGLSKKQTDQIIDGILTFSELGEFIHQPIKTYSSGMNARLAFAVAINVEPDILIVDEALSVGDAAFQRKCFAKMEEIRANGATILFVSHSESSIVSLCNRAIWLSNGEQILDGVPKLVTGLYLKYSNAKRVSKDKMLVEYQGLVNKEGDAKKFKANQCEKEKLNSLEELYDPALESTSRMSYEEKGASISEAGVKTLDGKLVNILVQGRKYIFSYRVKFKQDFDDAHVGMLIKNKEGVAVSGGGYTLSSVENSVQGIKKDTSIIVNWTFTCLLNHGEYFFNAGVKRTVSEGFLHRIVDCIMVKIPKNNELIRTGMCVLIDRISVSHKELN